MREKERRGTKTEMKKTSKRRRWSERKNNNSPCEEDGEAKLRNENVRLNAKGEGASGKP